MHNLNHFMGMKTPDPIVHIESERVRNGVQAGTGQNGPSSGPVYIWYGNGICFDVAHFSRSHSADMSRIRDAMKCVQA